MKPSAPTARPTRSRSHRTPRSKQPYSTTTPGRRSAPAAARRKSLRAPSPPAAAATSSRRDERAELRLIMRRTRLLGAQRTVAQLALPLLRHRQTRPLCRRRAHATVELAIRDLKESAGLSRCPSGILRQRRLARLLRARAQPRALDRPPRTRPPHAPAHRRGHHPQPAPHSAGPPRQPQRPTQSACRSTGHGQTPSPPPWDTSATCPSSSEPPTAPRRSAVEPHAPPTAPAPHPRSCTPQNAPARTHAPAQRPPGPNLDPTNPSVDSGLERAQIGGQCGSIGRPI